jgi:hypothetical protein
MNSNEPAVVTPVAAEADAQVEPRSCLRSLVGDIAKAAVAYLVTHGALLAMSEAFSWDSIGEQGGAS